MLQLSNNPAGIKTIVGRRLSRRLKRISPDFRAMLGHELMAGESVMVGLTRKQAAALVQVSLPYLSTVSRATPEQRQAIKRKQLSISALHNERYGPTDARLDRLIARYGCDRVLAALDRVTAPLNDGGVR